MRLAKKFTRRQFLTYHALMEDVPWNVALEAVSSVAIEHPEWDLEEEHTWDEWERSVAPVA